MTRRGRRFLFAAAVVANLVLLFWPRTVGGDGLPHLDKVAHAISFALVLWTGIRAGLPGRGLAAGLAVHAVASELLQETLLADRSGDPADVLADLAGVGGVALALGTASWRHERVSRRGRADGEAPGGHPGPG